MLSSFIEMQLNDLMRNVGEGNFTFNDLDISVARIDLENFDQAVWFQIYRQMHEAYQQLLTPYVKNLKQNEIQKIFRTMNSLSNQIKSLENIFLNLPSNTANEKKMFAKFFDAIHAVDTLIDASERPLIFKATADEIKQYSKLSGVKQKEFLKQIVLTRQNEITTNGTIVVMIGNNSNLFLVNKAKITDAVTINSSLRLAIELPTVTETPQVMSLGGNASFRRRTSLAMDEKQQIYHLRGAKYQLLQHLNDAMLVFRGKERFKSLHDAQALIEQEPTIFSQELAQSFKESRNAMLMDQILHRFLPYIVFAHKWHILSASEYKAYIHFCLFDQDVSPFQMQRQRQDLVSKLNMWSNNNNANPRAGLRVTPVAESESESGFYSALASEAEFDSAESDFEADSTECKVSI